MSDVDKKGDTGDTGDTREKPLGVLAAAIAAAPPPWWHWRRLRRLARQRWTPVVAAAVAGVLLGGTVVAWQAEAGPFHEERACWGALDEDDVADVFHGKRDIESSEVGVSFDRISSEGPSGLCELKSPRGMRVRAQLHRLDDRFGGAGDKWADEYLSARMAPLGGGLLGMASDTRAWLAIPEGCIGRPSEDDGPLVIDMEAGWTTYDDAVDTDERARLARAVVKLVNAYMADQGCDSAIGDPTDRLAAPARFLDEKRDAICGIKGLGLPGKGVGGRYDRPLVTKGDDAPVRTCDRDVLFGHPSLRLMTVEDPRLAVLYKGLSFDGGKEVKAVGDTKDEVRGRGFLREDMGLYQASCQTGEVTFLVRADDGRRAADVRRLLPRYVALEAERIGCGPLRLVLPS
ncbi:hypothetical protein ABT390_23245 [Streptomyces aurantiacus]|uniref:Uncharacterized protein n=1 Tax=Streptomyces aurantiacus JA 4570 TaxID=1286094 RepID=S3ZHN5_9ACTN|nr:hypothetical protein [Streptomyces aurantiacus]EPH42638.1 hypothetical protein STRAU_4318 [Streptomyces aurantiacus JA 4570]